MEINSSIFKNNKKVIFSTVFGTVLFLILVISATYSYFGIDQNNDLFDTNVNSSGDNIGNVAITPGDHIKLDITADDMSYQSQGNTYWATITGKPSLSENNITIANLSVYGNDPLYCDYTITINKSATNDMFTSFKNWSDPLKGYNQVVLNINDSESIRTYDFNDSTLEFPITITGRLSNLTEDVPRKLTSSFRIANLIDVDQTYISGTDINLSYTIDNFDCHVQENSNFTTITKKLIIDNSMWQSGLEGDSYRFIGTKDNVVNNYVCFGITDKTECLNNPGKYLYRIVGVFDDGSGNYHTKLIKYQSLTTTESWNSTGVDKSWEDTSIQKNLNASLFLANNNNNYFQDADWLNKIENWTWSSVNTKASSEGPNYYNDYTPSNMYFHELNRSSKTSNIGVWSTINTRIGLMYASDYTLSLGNTSKDMLTGSFDNKILLKNSWLHLSNNSYGISTGNYLFEWTMSKSGSGNAYSIATDGYVNSDLSTNTFSIRPVFYLKTNVLYNSGTGTISDPILLIK